MGIEFSIITILMSKKALNYKLEKNYQLVQISHSDEMSKNLKELGLRLFQSNSASSFYIIYDEFN